MFYNHGLHFYDKLYSYLLFDILFLVIDMYSLTPRVSCNYCLVPVFLRYDFVRYAMINLFFKCSL